MKQDARYTGLKHVSLEEYGRDGVALLREAERSPIVVCGQDGTPRMIVSYPIVTDAEILGHDDL